MKAAKEKLLNMLQPTQITIKTQQFPSLLVFSCLSAHCFGHMTHNLTVLVHLHCCCVLFCTESKQLLKIKKNK